MTTQEIISSLKEIAKDYSGIEPDEIKKKETIKEAIEFIKNFSPTFCWDTYPQNKYKRYMNDFEVIND